MKILIAEDDPVSQKLLEKIARHEGYDPVVVNNGKNAWDQVKKEKVDMVITDWMMPEMDGLQLCRKIRQTDLPRYVYVILLTAEDQVEDAVAVFSAGIFHQKYAMMMEKGEKPRLTVEKRALKKSIRSRIT
ncbi:MAG TPA: hypothetical protein DDW42_07865 [Desulfobacteraceae bacterium]|nr:hypothetical protein [Desulfobacteraceae bacterium]